MHKVSTGASKFKAESFAMKISSRFGFKKLRWSLRRLHVPVGKNELVLEVGAGGNPYPRANVMLDAMETTIERNEQDLIRDRPLVLGLCEELPFKDKSFDFIIASHVLEHTDNPEKFLSELMRVGRAGYIETPEGWFEKMCAFTYHRLEVSADRDKLLIRKKPSWKPDEIAKLWDIKLAKSMQLYKFLRINPDINHLRFYWEDSIKFEILNPNCNASWEYPTESHNKAVNIGLKNLFLALLRGSYLSLRRWLFSQNYRNKNLDIFPLLRCPTCHSEELKKSDKINQHLTCSKCNTTYEIVNNIPRLFPREISGFNETRTNMSWYV
ncbi:MAG: methyltransferase domain-containing protein [Polynucleobacter sp.]|nr:methyltransferase domain-containing protein [Polynucleobacter sp.]